MNPLYQSLSGHVPLPEGTVCLQPTITENPMVVDPDGSSWHSYRLTYDRNADTGIMYPSGAFIADLELNSPFDVTESKYYVIGTEWDPIAIAPLYNGQSLGLAERITPTQH